MDDEGVACRLHSAEFAARLREIERTVMGDVVRVEELADGFTFVFADGAGVIGRLAEFVVGERECCPFFRFSIEAGAPGSQVVLGIRGSAAAKEFARETFLPLLSIS